MLQRFRQSIRVENVLNPTKEEWCILYKVSWGIRKREELQSIPFVIVFYLGTSKFISNVLLFCDLKVLRNLQQKISCITSGYFERLLTLQDFIKMECSKTFVFIVTPVFIKCFPFFLLQVLNLEKLSLDLMSSITVQWKSSEELNKLV